MSEYIQVPEWARQGLCAQTDPDAFYPEKGGSTKEAKEICNGRAATSRMPATEPCPVRAECLSWALENGERFGIFGGKSERERRKLAREIERQDEQEKEAA